MMRQQQSPALLETLAMTQAEVGRYDEATRSQQAAISMAIEAGQRGLAARMRDNLSRYQQRQPCRRPWRQDDPVFAPGPKRDE
jgi:hypothetical protein